MPSFLDDSINAVYCQPSYDSLADKVKYQTIREADEVLEESIPREPTRQEELEYIDWL